MQRACSAPSRRLRSVSAERRKTTATSSRFTINENTGNSEVEILNAKDIAAGPIGRVILPCRVPAGFPRHVGARRADCGVGDMSVFIHDAVRTPRGKARPDGALAAIKPQDLVAGLVDALEVRNGDVRARAEMLALGCVGQVGAQGGHIALVSKFRSGLPDEMPAYTINNYCVSGLTAIGQAANAVAAGQVEFALAGGVESMSRVPFMGDKADFYAEAALPAHARYMPVVVAADMLAMDRERFAHRTGCGHGYVASQGRCRRGRCEGAALADRCATRRTVPSRSIRTKLCAPAPARNHCRASRRPSPRLQTPIRRWSAIAPSIIATPSPMRRRSRTAPGLAFIGGKAGKPRARILAYAEAGDDPRASLTAGFAAMDKVLKRANLSLEGHGLHRVHGSLCCHDCHVPARPRVDPAKVNAAGRAPCQGSSARCVRRDPAVDIARCARCERRNARTRRCVRCFGHWLGDDC